MGWDRLSRGRVEVLEVPGDHYTLLHEPYVQILASLLRERLAEPGAGEALVGRGLKADGTDLR